ncbi:MAG: RtcB family protein [Candidatus Coatesbacteria bacterium]|nr:MAG: RtcB family protein [Candidatus Coatesbacteria bacterium]
MAEPWQGPLEKVDAWRWRLPRSYDGRMRVDGLIYASEKMLAHLRLDKTPQQVANVASLPGIVGRSLAMPDIHWGYGFPIGGVAAMRLADGVVSPGGVGYDINCGVRLISTALRAEEIRDRVPDLLHGLFHAIPCGVGTKSKLRLSEADLKRVLREGSRWAVAQGYGDAGDLERTEAGGALPNADPEALSPRARERGRPQLGTLGAGNHFLEVGEVVEVLEAEAAAAMGLEVGGATLMIHSGSRGLGYQVCEDWVKVMRAAMAKYRITVPDQQLACAPVTSAEGSGYLGAMNAAANYAWANRQIMMHWAEEVFAKVLRASPRQLGMSLVYDVAHNIAKFERHEVEGGEEEVLVHRKGATRAFGPGHPELPEVYRRLGQPVIIPGDMGTASYVLRGTAEAMAETWGSTCHGAGRVMSRKEATRKARGRSIQRELEDRGIAVVCRSPKTLAEEMSEAYKEVSEVVEVVTQAGISAAVARLEPLGVIKG